MQRSVFHIIAAGVAAGFMAALYFLLLAVGGVPFGVAAVIIAGCIFLPGRYYVRYIAVWLPDEEKRPLLMPAILAMALTMAVTRAYVLAEAYGGWDAWSIWNLHAKYLANGGSWRNMLGNIKFGHPDYPLLVPGLTAFWQRLIPVAQLETIAFTLSFCFALMIPVVIYLHTAGRSIIVAAYTLFMLGTNRHFLAQGVSMYADTYVAFYFLAALIAIKHQVSGNKQVLVAAACLGCCIWTKNEGAVLAAIFSVFYYRELFMGGRVKYFFMGIGLPLLALVVFKVVYAPANDLVSGFSGETLHQLTDADRYGMIAKSFAESINTKYGYIKMGALLYGIICLIRRQWPGKDMLMVVCCAVAYFMIYVVSSMGLEWHLLTSADRLLHQLMPAAVMLIAERIAAPWTNMSFNFGRG